MGGFGRIEQGVPPLLLRHIDMSPGQITLFSAWTPLQDLGWLFDEDVDRSNPWQFGKFLAS
jgi:homospermidine synthase